jgi:hypothetical protein
MQFPHDGDRFFQSGMRQATEPKFSDMSTTTRKALEPLFRNLLRDADKIDHMHRLVIQPGIH